MESETSAERVDERIDEIVVGALRVDRSDFDDDTLLGPEGLDADSLAVVEMAETVDVELGVSIPDEDLEDLETVGDVKEYVRERAD